MTNKSPTHSGTGCDGNPLMSVIIPHYNDLANLDRCMRLLMAQTLPRSQFEVVVADNNSHCGLEEVERVCGQLAQVSLRPSRARAQPATPRLRPPAGAISLSSTLIAVRLRPGLKMV